VVLVKKVTSVIAALKSPLESLSSGVV